MLERIEQHHDWMRIELKLRTSIVEGISVFLSLFDDSPAVKRTFCPPKECYDPVANAHGIATASWCRLPPSWSSPAPSSRSTFRRLL